MKNLLTIVASIVVCAIILKITLFGKSIDGNKNYTTKTYLQNAEFKSIDVNNIGDLEIEQSNENSITIETDDNLFEFITVRLDKQTVIIDMKKSIKSKKFKVMIKIKELEKIKCDGLGNIEIKQIFASPKLKIDGNGCGNIDLNIDVVNFECDLNGTGSIKIKGKSEKAKIAMNGTGTFDAEEFAIQTAKVDLNGTGDVSLSVEKEIELESNGTGHLKIKNKPVLKNTK